jgi:nitrogen fixation/metabolism regulation signal transduction histidine kinase
MRLDGLLSEVYDNVVKPYNNSILKNQKEIREYIEEIADGNLKIYDLQELITEIDKNISILQLKASYIKIEIITPKETDIYCKINRLFFIAFNNILDNSVYALQKHVLNNNFNAILNIEIKIKNNKFISVSILDNAGGISKIYKTPIESSKNN